MKQLFQNMGLSQKLLIAPLVVLSFLVILGLVSYSNLRNQKGAIEDIFNGRFRAYQKSAMVMKDLANVHANLYKVISWANAKYDEKKIEELGKTQITTLEQAVAGVGQALSSQGLTREEKSLYGEISGLLSDYQKTAFSAIDLATSDLNMATMYMENADNKYQTLNKTLHELLSLEERLSQQSYDFSLQSFGSALKFLVTITAFAVVLSIVVSWALARQITTPIHHIMKVVHQIAEGDLTQEVKTHSSDEVGKLAESVETMRLRMGEAVGQSVSMSQSLSEAASSQAASLEETSSSLEEMTSMTKQNAKNASEANNLMTVTKNVITRADESMKELMASMREISTASEETVKIIKTIDEIAFQTNLLALNAAVEAARAGEAGAGFAVVAGEVRNLAMRAAEAARDTSALMEDIVKKVKNGDKLVNVTGEGFREIMEKASNVVQLIEEIAAASQEQAQGIEQINKAMADMNKTTQHNAAAAEQLASVMAMFRTNGNGSRHLESANEPEGLPVSVSRKEKRILPGEGITFQGKDLSDIQSVSTF